MGLCPLSLSNHCGSEGSSKLRRVLQRLIIASYASWSTKIQLGFSGGTDLYKNRHLAPLANPSRSDVG